MQEYFISFDFGIVKVDDIKVSDTDFDRVLFSLAKEFDIYISRNSVFTRYFLEDYLGNLQQFGYIKEV